MSRQYTDIEVRDIIENEGLDYAVRHYMGPEYIQNPVTAELWQRAEEALTALAKHLMLDDA